MSAFPHLPGNHCNAGPEYRSPRLARQTNGDGTLSLKQHLLAMHIYTPRFAETAHNRKRRAKMVMSMMMLTATNRCSEGWQNVR